MLEIAHNMLLLEMKDNKDKTIDLFHNYLSDNMTEEIATAVQKGKTLKGAKEVVIANAKKMGNVVAVEDHIVFGWVENYYLGKVSKTKTTGKSKSEVKKSIPKKKVESKSETQIGFEF